MTRKLTEKQQRFVEAYAGPSMGNATDAARRAGYAHPTTQGPRLLENVGVQGALKSHSEKVRSAAIADTEECQKILTEIARSTDAEDKDRIAASRELCKMQGAYVQKHEHEHKGAAVRVFFPSDGRGPEPAD